MYSNLSSIRDSFVKRLSSIYTAREAENMFYVLMADAFNKTKLDMSINGLEFSAGQEQLFEGMVSRLMENEPIQYVIGKALFMDDYYTVDRSTLIPRPETEELVSWIVQESRNAAMKLWDIGTGSGCIGISVKKLKPGSKVILSDVSLEALSVARQNATSILTEEENNDLITLKNDVLTEGIPLEAIDVNTMVSNPPYIPYKDRGDMTASVLNFEPSLALFVEDNDPLIFYRRILELSKTMENLQKVYFEIHEDLKHKLEELLVDFDISDYQFKKDLQGKFRMLKCEL